MRLVVALGGHALLRRSEPPEVEVQGRNVARAAAAIAAMAQERALVVTHGNGPQVGLLALQAESYAGVRPYPLDVLGAESEGMIGYMIERELKNRLPGREVATLLTQVVVDPRDAAFAEPTGDADGSPSPGLRVRHHGAQGRGRVAVSSRAAAHSPPSAGSRTPRGFWRARSAPSCAQISGVAT